MLSSLQFIAHYNKYVYIEFNKLENQYTVQNYRYYATNRQCIFAQPDEKWANQYFFFRFRNRSTYEFCSNFRRRPPGEWKAIIDILPKSESFVNSCKHSLWTADAFLVVASLPEMCLPFVSAQNVIRYIVWT